MATPNQPATNVPDLFTEMIDDYYAECDEHLVELRRQLLELEGTPTGSAPDSTLIFETYRRFHSLKGLSGMVSYVELEELAHHVESFLRVLREDYSRLDTSALDVIFAAVQAFEEGLSLRKSNNQPADLSALIEQVRRLLPATGETPESETPATPVASPVSPLPAAPDAAKPSPSPAQPPPAQPPPTDGPIWHITFTPSAALQARGITVNAIRERLQARGKLRQSTPVVLDGGGIAFAFLVAELQDESILQGGAQDGLEWWVERPHTEETGPKLRPATSLDRLSDDGHPKASPRIEAAAPEVAPSESPRPTPIATSFVRVELDRVDELMQLVGDLVTVRARLADAVNRLADRSPFAEWSLVNETTQTLERKLRSLREGVMRVRLVPIGETFVRMQFVVRDLAREYDKQIQVELKGKETEIDKLIVDRLMDPLLHLVRNSVSHGLESSAERLAAGKSAEGCLTLRALTEGNSVVVEVEDDGRGIDPAKIARKAREMGLWEEDTALTENSLLQIISTPGFSTKEVADRGAGRGIGMPAVQETIRELGGALGMESTPGKGTKFRITVPLTLAIADAIIFSVSDRLFAIPQITINEVAEVALDQIVRHPGGEILHFRGKSLRLIRLDRRFGLAESEQSRGFLLVVGSKRDPVGLLVDKLLGVQEIVVRAVSDPLVDSPDLMGASELGDGRAVLILDSFSLVNQTVGALNA